VKTSELREKLEAASVELPGLPGRWVRASVALPMLGLKSRNRIQWERPRGMRDVFLVPIRQPCPSNAWGVRVYYAIPNILGVAAYRCEDMPRAWTPQEDEVLRDMAWRESWGTIGRKIHRSPQRCFRRAKALGLDRRDLTRRRDGALSVPDLAALFGVSDSCVKEWIRYRVDPLPTSRLNHGHRDHRIDLRVVRVWLMKHPIIVARMPGSLADRIGLDVQGGKVIDLKSMEGAA
jgi:hypothetical protein